MKNARRGFTITEMAIAVALSAIIIFGTFAFLQASNKQLEIIYAKMSLQESLREALFKMAQEIRQTAWHKIDNNFGADGTDGMQRTNTLSFVVPVPAPDATTLVDANFSPKWASNIQYSLDDNTHQILRTSTDLTTLEKRQAVLANEITAMTFSRPSNSPELVTIEVSAQHELPGGEKIPEEPIQLTARAEVRNP